MRGGTLAIAAAAILSLAGPALGQTAGGGEAAAPMAACGGDLARLNQLTGWQARWPQELAAVARQPADAQAASLVRWRAAPQALRNDMTALRAGLRDGRAAPAPVARRVLAQVDGVLAAGPLASDLTDPAWRTLLDGELRREIEAYAAFVRTTYIPAAPPASNLPRMAGGPACFERAVETWSSRALTAPELETLGQSLLARYRRELTALAGKPEREAPQVLAALRAGDGATVTRDDILRLSEAAMARAEAALPRAFDAARVPHLTVTPIPPALEGGLPAGLYDQAAPGRPAVYRINLSRPTERRLMVEAIAFHEGVPGHHLAFSLATTPGAFNSGFVEGWAIYAEHLADELGLYSSRQDRMGAAAKHMWAAARLVVEPGLHIHGWTRERAIAFLRDNTPMSDAEIAIEVDRYLALPGQSVSYMVGYDVIAGARARTEARQGAAFGLPAFHRALLAPGPRDLDTVAAEFP